MGSSGDRPIVFLNYYVHPDRKARHLDTLGAALGAKSYRLTDELSEDDRARVRIVVNKTREISDETLRAFPAVAGICLATTQDWMLTFDPARSPIAVRAVDVDRGTNVAEVALMLMLVGLKRLGERRRWHALRSPTRLYRQLRPPLAGETVGGHNWTSARTWTAYGKRIGIVGYGLIGREIHRRVEGFGAEVVYHAAKPYSAALEQRIGARYRELGDLFRECDVIFVQLPLTASTRGLIADAELAAAKRHLVLVNCGRAAVIDKRALETALVERRIGFYGADVFWREPVPLWDRFRRLSNALVTPHFSESVADAASPEQAVARALALLMGDLDGQRARA